MWERLEWFRFREFIGGEFDVLEIEGCQVKRKYVEIVFLVFFLDFYLIFRFFYFKLFVCVFLCKYVYMSVNFRRVFKEEVRIFGVGVIRGCQFIDVGIRN